MADFFAKGKRPINGYGGAQHGFVELWVNPNPDSNFAGQTINITVDKNFDAILCDYGELSGGAYRGLGTIIVEIGRDARVSYVYMTGAGKIGELYRLVTASQVGNVLSVTLTDCTNRVLNSYSSAPSSSTANDELMPFRILGLIHND